MSGIRLITRLLAFALFLCGTCVLTLALLVADRVRKQPTDKNAWATFCFRQACRYRCTASQPPAMPCT